MNGPVSVLLADDHALVRGALASWLQSAPDITVVADVSNADDACTEALRLQPDVVVLDIDMPGLLCFDAATKIKRQCPQTRIIFLSAFFHDRYIEQALEVQASGYVTKGEPPESVLKAIRTVAAGGTCFSPEVQSRIVIDPQGPRLAREQHSRSALLSRRELEVLRYLARGTAKKEIARTMSISVRTAEKHSANLMRKLDIHDRVEFARFAIREGLAEA